MVEGDRNPYAYAAANPIMATDPLGLLCRLPSQWQKCLSQIFGFPVQKITVHDNSALTALTGGMYFTMPGRIFLPGSCSDFYSSPRLVLHEYYHVVDQGDTKRMSLGKYLWEAGGNVARGRDPHRDNRFEEEANFFARTHEQNLEDCLGCAPLPPDFDPCPPGSGAMTRALGTTCN